MKKTIKVRCTSSSVSWFKDGCEYNFDGEYVHDNGCYDDQESYVWEAEIVSPTILTAADGRAYFVRVA